MLDQSTKQLLTDWKRRCRESQRNHYTAANRYMKRNRWVGTPAIVLSAILGTGVLASMESHVSMAWRIAAGLIGVAAAVLTALQVNLNHSERAERHKTAGARYAAVRREIEQTLSVEPGGREDLLRILDKIRDRMDSLAEQSPALPPDLWDKGGEEIAVAPPLKPLNEREDNRGVGAPPRT